MKLFSDQIRAAIRASRVTMYRLALEAGVRDSSLSRFMSSDSGLSTHTLDRISKVLRLEVTMKGPRKKLLREHGVK